MLYFEFKGEFGPDVKSLEGSTLNISATHFTNQILIQIRASGEMDSTYEVTQRGIRPMEQIFSRPIAGQNGVLEENEEEEEEFETMRDHLSDYNVIVRLGDSNDAKIPVICTQIANLYQTVILPQSAPVLRGDNFSGVNLLITLNSKMWRQDENDSNVDFAKLVFLLKSIKEMYVK
ncbi:hypothetical protein KAFR_0J01180 [Kazachstania africana CBS 2517]|uniref:Proteasome chaperone 3 n=1 Tax=Kazachstania africana (strain ATCC 22294 / BCRC 22015 / CBS 2517 / CECT 1963 / NBRC 1671 / NRRL Y-8276) TaxID=1071382 RepID=H2B0N5_KAZAF|nr:hypothetical protein KAFR_0J01180 [Kazachstania africana CBS 2517]CCF60185.1 hypothetical protein KAFR_0J01180 [Kazachstania africana CBS 2517]